MSYNINFEEEVFENRPSTIQSNSSTPTSSYPLHPLAMPHPNPRPTHPHPTHPLVNIAPPSFDWASYSAFLAQRGTLFQPNVNLNIPHPNLPNLNIPTNFPTSQSSQTSQSTPDSMPCYNQTQTPLTQSQDEQTRVNSQQPEFVASTQEDEIQELPSLPPSVRSVGFKTAEDVLLTKLWLKYSEDGITGVDQTKDTFWKKIFDEFQIETPNKTVFRKKESLQKRWSKLQCTCTKFHAVHTKCCLQHPSGKTYECLLKLALSDYQVKWGTTFKCMECWDIVKEHAKWKQAVKSLEEADKRAQAQKKVIHEVAGDDDDDDADAVVVQIKNKGGRPPGRGAQKAARKAAQENTAAMKSSSDTFSYYVDRLEKKDERLEKNEERRFKLQAEQSASNDLLAQSAMKLASAIESKGKRKEIEIMKDMVTQKMLEPGALEGMSSKKKEETMAVKNKLIYHMAKWAKSCIGSSDESD